jgi:hypothetical protein
MVGDECLRFHAQHNQEWAHKSPLKIIICMISRVLLPLLPRGFADFVAMHVEIQDADAHTKLQNNLVENLWRLKGNSEATSRWSCPYFIRIVLIFFFCRIALSFSNNYKFACIYMWIVVQLIQKNKKGFEGVDSGTRLGKAAPQRRLHASTPLIGFSGTFPECHLGDAELCPPNGIR